MLCFDIDVSRLDYVSRTPRLAAEHSVTVRDKRVGIEEHGMAWH